MPERATSCPHKSAFTTVQWIVVVAVLAVLIAVVIPVFSYGREAARRTQCADNLRQIGVAMERYAEENQGKLPAMEPGIGWAWDTAVNVTTELLETGAVEMETFYCPSGRFDQRFVLWEHGVTRTRNEEKGVRILSYVILLNGARGVLPAHFNETWGTTTASIVESKPVQIPASQRELAVDAVLSAGGGRSGNFHNITMGTSATPDRTNHLKGNTPAGGNILFLDGHVEWRDFADMDETKVYNRPVFWW